MNPLPPFQKVSVTYCGRGISLLVEVTKNKPAVVITCSWLYILQGSLGFCRTGKLGSQVLENMLRRVVQICSVEWAGLLRVCQICLFVVVSSFIPSGICSLTKQVQSHPTSAAGTVRPSQYPSWSRCSTTAATLSSPSPFPGSAQRPVSSESEL